LIGDSCIDEYHYGTVDRISPEAPVPVFVPKKIVSKNGMAANVLENLKALGVEVIPYFGENSVKVRMIDERSNQHLMRIDKDIISKELPLNTYFPSDIDGIIISDYNKGFVSYDLIEALISTGVPVFVDTKKRDLRAFSGAFVKINQNEFADAKSLPNENLIVTLGKNGAMYDGVLYEAPNVNISDVCGAGDTFLAAFAYQYLQTKNEDKAMSFAVKASSVTVQYVGVYAPTLEEIL
jgi:bifunctional ADP-heptose synthase (sugar kinase/adenylyltransferase)